MTDVPTKTLYRVEIRALIVTLWLKVLVYNPMTKRYQQWSLKRGRWYVAHFRSKDRRYVFNAAPGTRRLVGIKEAKKARRNFRAKGFAVRLVPVQVALYPNLRGDLDAKPAILGPLEKFAKRLGKIVDVLSGGRTLDEQQHLYDLYLAGIGNVAAPPNANAPHVRRIAVDAYINGRAIGSTTEWRRIARECGMYFPVDGEDWHAQPVGT